MGPRVPSGSAPQAAKHMQVTPAGWLGSAGRAGYSYLGATLIVPLVTFPLTGR